MRLRAATLDDGTEVYRWNFAPEVRAASGDTRMVTFAEHMRWYAARLDGGHMWIIEDEEPVGIVRIDIGRISIALDASARGRGLGRAAIREACERWGKPVFAEIRNDNPASRAAFEACGFVAGKANAEFTTYHWRP